MSYILTPATVVPSPTTVANGGTGSTTKAAAMTALSTASFSISSQRADWGQYSIIPPVGESATNNEAAITNLINTLITLGVLI